jgi:hypothetical protein
VSSRARDVDPGRRSHWCVEHLGSPPTDEIFRSGYLSAVIGLRLADGRAVVVKVRPGAPRVAACVAVQRRLFASGYPCPEPLTGATPFGDELATAEAYVPGGAVLPSADRAAWAFAEAFARLVKLAPRPAEVSTLDPAPSWAAWDHAEAGLWPRPADSDVNLNEVAGPGWIDGAGRRARDRLQAGASEPVIGHCDWLAGNLRWSGDNLLVAHDWDSVTVDSEAVLAGFAAALYSTVSADERLPSGKRSSSLRPTEMPAAGSSARTNSSGRGRPVSGRGPTTPSTSMRSGNRSYRSPRMRPASASVVPRPLNGDHRFRGRCRAR